MGVRYRVASTLSLLVLVAFAFELIAVLSVPVTSKITLCEYQGIKFGVFGYCDTKTNKCSKIGVGYDIDINTFSLPSDARQSLANLLVVHVVAAALSLILLLFSLIGHLHGPANSTRFILFVLVFALLSFLLTLLAFLVDILLFGAHLSWGGWLMLAATVLLLLAVVVLFIMRRMTSSENAMRRRMNGPAMNEMGPENDPFSQTGYGPGSFKTTTGPPNLHELKYETSPSTNQSGAPGAGNYEEGHNNNSFVMPDTYETPAPTEPPYSDSYDQAASRAYRGNAGRGSIRTNASGAETDNGSIAGANVPAAGSYIGGDDRSPDDYGPNVVPIPRLRPDRQTNRKPSGPRPYNIPDPAGYQESANYQAEAEAAAAGAAGAGAAAAGASGAGAASNEYIPPRMQWNQAQTQAAQQQQQYSEPVGSGLYERPPVVRMSPAPRQSKQYFTEGPTPYSAEIVDDSNPHRAQSSAQVDNSRYGYDQQHYQQQHSYSGQPQDAYQTANPYSQNPYSTQSAYAQNPYSTHQTYQAAPESETQGIQNYPQASYQGQSYPAPSYRQQQSQGSLGSQGSFQGSLPYSTPPQSNSPDSSRRQRANVLDSNPDFQVRGSDRPKQQRRSQVSQQQKAKGGMPAAFATNDSPYNISRKAPGDPPGGSL